MNHITFSHEITVNEDELKQLVDSDSLVIQHRKSITDYQDSEERRRHKIEEENQNDRVRIEELRAKIRSMEITLSGFEREIRTKRDLIRRRELTKRMRAWPITKAEGQIRARTNKLHWKLYKQEVGKMRSEFRKKHRITDKI